MSCTYLSKPPSPGSRISLNVARKSPSWDTKPETAPVFELQIAVNGTVVASSCPASPAYCGEIGLLCMMLGLGSQLIRKEGFDRSTRTLRLVVNGRLVSASVNPQRVVEKLPDGESRERFSEERTVAYAALCALAQKYEWEIV
ncbi:MAG: hypothetical protein WCO52_01235 [bacterium]